MTEPHCCSIAIVGGGCSGLLVAAQLFRRGFAGRVSIIEPKAQLGAGLAYSTSVAQHLLNVPAAKMSALPDQPAHFLDWLRQRFPHADANGFAPRKLYREYLQYTLDQSIPAASSHRFSHIRAEAVAAYTDSNGAILTLSDGSVVCAERVVLALGNPASSWHPGATREGLEECWELSPWFAGTLRVRFAGERILLVGTGLTAVDAALALLSGAPACEITMVSRRGLLPQVHNGADAPISTLIFQSSRNLRLLFREVRSNIRAAKDEGSCWRTVIDALRADSNGIWRNLPLKDKQRFFRHLKAHWETHRHRMAPAIRNELNRHRARGALRILAGRIATASSHEGTVQVCIRLRHGGENVLHVDRVVSCTGIHEGYRNSSRPLIRSLIENRVAFANDLGIGFRADRHGALLGKDLIASSVFFTLGPPLLGELFETTAVPEIRVQADALASHLTSLRADEPVSSPVL